MEEVLDIATKCVVRCVFRKFHELSMLCVEKVEKVEFYLTFRSSWGIIQL